MHIVFFSSFFVNLMLSLQRRGGEGGASAPQALYPISEAPPLRGRSFGSFPENVNNMPESSREIETELEAVVEERQQMRQEKQASRNIVTVLSQFANDNLSLVRVGVFFV